MKFYRQDVHPVEEVDSSSKVVITVNQQQLSEEMWSIRGMLVVLHPQFILFSTALPSESNSRDWLIHFSNVIT